MRFSSTGARRFVARAAIPMAVLLAAGTVWQASYAAFSADTRNSGNSWSSGTITMTGTVMVGGRQLFISRDHGETWTISQAVGKNIDLSKRQLLEQSYGLVQALAVDHPGDSERRRRDAGGSRRA